MFGRIGTQIPTLAVAGDIPLLDHDSDEVRSSIHHPDVAVSILNASTRIAVSEGVVDLVELDEGVLYFMGENNVHSIESGNGGGIRHGFFCW
jgi:hypothetical protein